MKATLMTLVLIAFCTASVPIAEADPVDAKEVEALQREVRDLKAQLRTLSTAASEVAELTMRSAAIWARALSGQARAEAEEPPPRAAPKPKRETARAAKKKTPRARPPEKDVGTVRGKVEVPKGEPIAYAYVENVFAPPVRGKKVAIDQKNKRFIPSWAVVRRGTTIEFPNHDNIYHNVFSRSSGNSFDLGLYNSGASAKTHTFQSPGSVDIYCNIHPKMAASVLVVPNRLFAKIKSDGSFTIKNVPSGERKIVAWSPGSKLATQWVELDDGGTADVELKLERKSRVHKNKLGRAYGSYE